MKKLILTFCSLFFSVAFSVAQTNPKPGYIYKKNHHIAIDCGSFIPGGRLAAICLDTGEEFYSEAKKR